MTTSIRALIELDDAAIEAAFMEHISWVSIDELVFVTDPLHLFREARQSWRAPGVLVADTDSLLHINRLQVRQGETRQELIVIDFGVARATYSCRAQ